MERKFDAFISYRHHPLDSEVASAVQRQLERFVIPRAVRKKTGKNRINHIFRDKEELPVTSDLNDNIGLALSNSEYLIVICSPRTKESIWVLKEIELFMKTHTRDKVLTVLAEGEPGDVIPEVLLSEEIKTVDESGKEITVAVPREPLSCDYRMGIRKAKSVELLRLAASILGCPFDDLKQRMQQYRMRKLITVFSIIFAFLLIFSGYVLWSSKQIKQNYELAQSNYELAQHNFELSEQNYQLAQDNYAEAQKNYQETQKKQSQHMAVSADKLLSEGNRTLALRLALAALPNDEDNRPFVPEAEYALSKALYAYQSGNEPKAKVTLPYSYKSDISQEYNRYIAQSGEHVFLYDTESGGLIASVPCSALADSLTISKTQDCFLFESNDCLKCYSVSAGEKLWETSEGYRFLAANEEGTRILAAKSVYGQPKEIYVMDFLSGEVQNTYILPEDSSNIIYRSVSVWMEDVALCCLRYSDGNSIEILNLQTMEYLQIPLEDQMLGMTLEKTTDNKLLLFNREYKDGSTLKNQLINGTASDGRKSYMSMIGDSYASVVKYDLTGKSEWSLCIPFAQTIGCPSLKPMLSEETSQGAETKSWIAYIANKYLIFDQENGTVIKQGEIPGVYSGSIENTRTGKSRFITEDGKMGMIGLEDDSSDITALQYFPSEIYNSSVQTDGNNMYLNKIDSDELIHYAFMNDEQYVAWDETLDNISEKKYVFGNRAICYSYSYHYDLLDFDTDTIVDSVSFTDRYPTALGVTPDGLFVYRIQEKNSEDQYVAYIMTWDMVQNRKGEPIELLNSFVSEAYLVEDKVLYRISSGWILCDLNTKEQTEVTWDMDKNIAVNHTGTQIFKMVEKTGFLSDSQGETMILEDMDTDKKADALKTVFSQMDQYLCVATDNLLYIIDCNKKNVMFSVALGDDPVADMKIYEEKTLFVVTKSGALQIFSLETGALLSRQESLFESPSSSAELKIQVTSDGQIAVLMGKTLYFLDATTYSVRQYSMSVYYYDNAKDRIIQVKSLGNNQYELRAYVHYSVEDLQQQAKNVLEDIELSEDIKKTYGLE